LQNNSAWNGVGIPKTRGKPNDIKNKGKEEGKARQEKEEPFKKTAEETSERLCESQTRCE
jgi:hypothetical protein